MDILKDYLKLRNVKSFQGLTKNLQAQVYFTENPSVNFKTPMYFVEMIKSVGIFYGNDGR